MAPILSVNELAWKIGIPIARLRQIGKSVHKHYRVFPKWIAKDKVRTFRVPDDELMDIQRRIVQRVLNPIGFGDEVHGGIRGRSAATNAAVHRSQNCVVNLDVKSFFDKVRHEAVYRMFRHDLGFGRDVASLLTRLTTFRSLLPQGAPTSPAVANLVLAMPVDAPLASLVQDLEVKYTRFVDDLTFSGKDPRRVINVVARLLSRRRLQMYRKKSGRKSKLRITPRSRPQEVTGLLVNASRTSVPRKRRDSIRAAIFGLRSLMGEAHIRAEVRSIHGRIAHVGRFNPGEALRLKRYLSSTLGEHAGSSTF